ncbi:MAG: hypothetical protein EPO26_02570 [Chloroflexota bacterium]|nr:MAG: hypothetical protein EPO26_02570 [Chloroflexota bacterium]
MNRFRKFANAVARVVAVAGMLLGTLPFAAAAAAAPNDPDGYFSETGFAVGEAKFWDYFNARGGLRTFGYPASRVFMLDGFKVQLFQRRALQLAVDGNVTQLNLLDHPFLPYTSFNGATIPALDSDLLKSAPTPGSPAYGEGILDYVDNNSPNTALGRNVGFNRTFRASVTMAEAFARGGGNSGLLSGIHLEMWGVPTSRSGADPNNGNFIFLRFQRGVMHYDAATGLTQGMLLGDHFKQILTGVNLPGDLASQAKDSPYLHAYDNSQANGIRAGKNLPNSNLKDAFEKEAPRAAPGLPAAPAATPVPAATAGGPAPTTTSGLRMGWQAHLYGHPHDRIFRAINDSGFTWVKQQVRWATHNPNDLDQAVESASRSGVKLLASVLTTPPGLRGGRGEDGPPDNYAEFGKFVGGLAQRYKGRINAYELWNEQNFSREWGGGQINACDYVRLLREGYNAIKAADPTAVIISGALTPTGVNDPNLAIDDKTYLTQMYQCNGGEFLRIADAVGAHMAGYNNAPEDGPGQQSVNTPGYKGHMSFYFRRIDDLYEVMRNNGDRRQMWLTEYHWAAASAPVPAGYEWTTHLSEGQASDFLARSIQSIRSSRPWVGAVFIWNLNFRTFQDYHKSETAIFGFLNPDWTPRQLYNAVKSVAR